jgi:hypothetical protein
MLMAIDLIKYSEVLKGWLKSEVKKYKSWEAFARAITSRTDGRYVTGQTLRNWANKTRKETLPDESILLLAAYRQEDAKQTEAWLSGAPPNKTSDSTPAIAIEGPAPSPFVRSIARRLKQASLAEISAILDLASQRLHQIQAEDTSMDVGEAGTEQDSLIAMAVSSMLLIADIDPDEFGRRIGVTEAELALVLNTDAQIPRTLINKIGDGLRTLGPIWTDRALISLERSRVADCELDPQPQQELL